MDNIIVTVFTTTYNRAHTLGRLWKSLKSQTCYQFEWLVVDDGSQDETPSIIQEFTANTTEFPIVFLRKGNGGKHRAINYAVQYAKGELFFIVDSDDWLPENAISTILSYYKPIRMDSSFAGIAGCKCDAKMRAPTSTFTGDYLDITSLEREKYNIRGEKAEVFKTEVLCRYPFPCFEGENFISEGIVWNKIAYDGYKLRWFNENIYSFEYQEDGITSNLRDIYRKNPRGYLTYVSCEMIYKNISRVKKYNWCGRCIDTVGDTVPKHELEEILKINGFEYEISKIVFILYKLFRRQIS